MPTACPSQRAGTLQFTRTSSARSISRRPASRSCAAGRSRSSIARENVQVAILNTAAAQLLFGNDNPIGRRIGSGRQGPTNLEVVGVVENAKYLSVREAPIPTVYVPFRGRQPDDVARQDACGCTSALRVIEQEVKALDPTLPLFQVQTIEARVDDALRQERLVATLATILGVAAMLIAAVGIYGLISFSVAQRTREIGIRLAVGAEPRQILLMVSARACLLVAARNRRRPSGCAGLISRRRHVSVRGQRLGPGDHRERAHRRNSCQPVGRPDSRGQRGANGCLERAALRMIRRAREAPRRMDQPVANSVPNTQPISLNK